MLDRSQSYLLVVLGSDIGTRFDHIGGSGEIYIPSSPRVPKAALTLLRKKKSDQWHEV